MITAGKMRWMVVLMLVVLAGSLTACRRAEVTDIERNPDGGVDVTLTLAESDINEVIQQALAVRANPLLRNPQVDLQAGQIVINGEHDRRDGSGTVNGSVTVQVTVADGKLQATVVGLQIEGVDLNDERVTTFNQRVNDLLNSRAAQGRGQITVQSVSISETQMDVVLNAQR